MLSTVSTPNHAPVIAAQRLRMGSVGCPRGAAWLIGDALATTARLYAMNDARRLVRSDSAYYGHAAVHAALASGADVSMTVRIDPVVKKAIAAIDDDAPQTIKYTDAIYDNDIGRWISSADVAEIDFTAFSSKKRSQRVSGRLVVRRILELNPKPADEPTLFDTHRFHAFFITSNLDTVTTDKVHRQHSIIEQVNVDLKGSDLAHLPSRKFNANAAWLVLAAIAFNLTRAAAMIAGAGLSKATTATIRATLISVPDRVASSARKVILHLPRNWPWETAWKNHFIMTHSPPQHALA